MRLTPFIVAAAVLASVAGQSSAQTTHSTDTLIVMTVRLKHLSSTEAVKLLQPYARMSLGGDVFAVPNVRAVTIRETAATFARMQKVLADYDRSPSTISLNFQLIA